jgi:hypothetical protein
MEHSQPVCDVKDLTKDFHRTDVPAAMFATALSV